jgi:DNA-binding NarL/FixJ family response regulator
MTDERSPPFEGELTRIAVIEDDKILLSLLGRLLRKQPDFEFVGAWPCPETALEELPATKPDIVIVDLNLPVMSGDVCIRKLSPLLPDTAFVVLTVHGTEENVFSALRAGASGYLLKSSPPTEILFGLRSIREGGAALSPAVASMVISKFRNPLAQRDNTTETLPKLSPREQQLLELLAAGRAPKEAASDLNLSYETVRGYLKKIYQKLHVRSQTEAVVKFLSCRPADSP